MSRLLAGFSLLACLTTGIAIANRCWSGTDRSPANRALSTVLGAGIGLGLAAVSATIETSFVVAPTMWCRGLELGCGLAALVWLAYQRAHPTPPGAAGPPHMPRWLGFAFGLLIVLALVLFLRRAVDIPHGDYDAIANWNQRASMLVREPASPQPLRFQVWAGQTSTPHTDYPPLLPHTVSRLWRALGDETWWAPAVLGLAFATATVLVLWLALKVMRSRTLAAVAGCALLGTTSFPYQAAGQIADVQVGFFYLCTVVAIGFALQPGTESRRGWVLVGMAAGSALLCKNEGTLFVAAFGLSFVVLLTLRHGARTLARCAWVLVGGVPFVIALLCHRALTPANELLPFHRFGDVMQLALDGQRWREGVPAFCSAVFGFGKGLAVLLLLLGWWLRRQGTMSVRTHSTIAMAVFLAFGLCLLTQFGLAILSPYGTRHHIDTTQARLVLQWWPSLIFAVLLTMRDPWHGVAPACPSNHGF
ncbi:MAG: glycosyltransferase family 39 protein [Planctomycetota bacterium]